MSRECLAALAFASAMAVATPTPGLAQGVYLQRPGFGVDTGRPAYRERYYRGDRDADRSYAYERRRFGGCRTITIERDDGSVRTVRRCD
jgi:hypothetical protein